VSGLLLAPVIAIAVLLGVAAILAVQQGRQHHLVGRRVQAQAGTPTLPAILYFTGEACSICKTAQTPALRTLEESLGGRVSVREIDVAREPELARAYRVLTLPTTVVLDASGAVADINVGFAAADKLRGQLAQAGLAAAA